MEEDIAQPVVPTPVLYKFTNQEESSEMDNILAMFYQGVYSNTMGIMTSWNLEKEREEVILVGVQLDEDGKADCYPLCVLLRAEDTSKYLAPNGVGGYYDPLNPTETAEAKEAMRSYDKAVIN